MFRQLHWQSAVQLMKRDDVSHHSNENLSADNDFIRFFSPDDGHATPHHPDEPARLPPPSPRTPRDPRQQAVVLPHLARASGWLVASGWQCIAVSREACCSQCAVAVGTFCSGGRTRRVSRVLLESRVTTYALLVAAAVEIWSASRLSLVCQCTMTSHRC